MPATVALDHNVDTESRSHIVQMRENANTMYRALLRDASAPERFFGWPYRHDDPPMEHYGCGTVELKPHNTVHDWVGNRSAVGLKDMGTFHLAAHDPLFYAHHAQIDRLWELWKAIPGHRDIDDDDYVNAEFLFYNEYGEMVRVKAGDASDLNLLGYRYEGVDTPWMHYVPDRRSAARAKLNATHKLCVIGEDMLTAPCSFTVARDPSVTKSSPWLEERLVLTMLFNQSQIKVDIYLNYPSVSSTADTGCEEYLTDVSLTQADLHWDTDRDGGIGNKTVRIPITERLISLDLMEEHNIVVTLVPKTSPSLLSAGRIAMLDSFVEYAAPYKRWTNEDEES
ncbi:hypothetical protein KP509_15G008900 [Ceratopteris richardii]|nr:hypothetical protein KP509_15G008900 [Ceratopteris richardii]